jgi:tetratricopeptide (TPR) repeat protein
MLISLAILAMDFGDFDQARQLNDRALAIVRELGDRMLEGAALMNQGSAATQAGDLDGGLHLSLEAVTLLRQVDNRYYLGHALRGLAAALFHKERFNDALDTYREAAELAAELDPRLLAQAEAGMAEVFLAQAELDSAMVHVEGALKYLQSLPMGELEEPFTIAIICYRVLASRGDPRAPDLLQSAYNALFERAARISDPARREAYLRKVPAHAEIVSTSEAGPTN